MHYFVQNVHGMVWCVIMNKVWFTSDQHFSHSNVIKYCDRPFKDVDHMNRVLIENWNSVVQPEDTVYMLGDIFFTTATKAMSIMDQLVGKKVLVYGNHDKVIRDNKSLQNKFDDILGDYKELTIDEQKIVLCHFPFLHFNGQHRGHWNLHGHIHSSGNNSTQPNKRQYDVGVDNNNYFPVSFEEIKGMMEKITDFESHH